MRQRAIPRSFAAAAATLSGMFVDLNSTDVMRSRHLFIFGSASGHVIFRAAFPFLRGGMLEFFPSYSGRWCACSNLYCTDRILGPMLLLVWDLQDAGTRHLSDASNVLADDVPVDGSRRRSAVAPGSQRRPTANDADGASTQPPPDDAAGALEQLRGRGPFGYTVTVHERRRHRRLHRPHDAAVHCSARLEQHAGPLPSGRVLLHPRRRRRRAGSVGLELSFGAGTAHIPHGATLVGDSAAGVELQSAIIAHPHP